MVAALAVALILASVSAILSPAEAMLPTVEKLDRLCQNVRAAALLDASGGEPLYLHNAEHQLPPASTVKLMLLLATARAVESGHASPADSLTASHRAFQTGGQQIYVAEGDVFTLEAMALATAVHSANDAAVMLAEGVFGSYGRGVAEMNAIARELSLTTTEFHSPHGLPESWGHRGDRSCALDLALLGRAAARNPLVRRWCSTPRTDVPGRDLVLLNSNDLLGEVDGVIGMKTGFTQQARYCFIGAAERDGRTLVCAVLGADSSRNRFALAEALLEYGFGRTHPRTVVREGAPVAVRETHGGGQVALVATRSLAVAVEPERIGLPAFLIAAPDTLDLPLENGQIVGDLIVMIGNHVVGRVPAAVDRGVSPGIARRLIDALVSRD